MRTIIFSHVLLWNILLKKKQIIKKFDRMVTSSELRDRLARSDFFSKIGTKEFGRNLTGSSGSVLYGIHNTQDKVISCSNAKVKELFSSPIHAGKAH